MRFFGLARVIVCAGLAASSVQAIGAHDPVIPQPSQVTRRPVVAAANGDWRQWRGNPQHTGYQSLPARIANPRIEWRYRLGGAVSAGQVLVADAGPASDARVYVAVGGRLQAYDGTGGVVFDRNPRLSMILIGEWDFAGDGKRQILAATSEIGSNRLLLFDADTGEMVWEGPETDGQIGAVKVLGSSRGSRIVWLPAASSRMSCLDFSASVQGPRTVWEKEISAFVSDPYTYSALGVSDLSHDGSSDVVVAGARGSVAVIILDAVTGTERLRVSYPDVRGLESGGERQLLYIGDLDGTGHDQILCVSGHTSDSQFMFQGATVTDPDDPGSLRVFDTAPVGLRFVPGSVVDFDGDGRLDLLVSRYDPNARRHDLILLDAATLALKWSYPNFLLLAVLPRTDGSIDVLGVVDAVAELPQIEGALAGLHFEPSSGGFRELWRRSETVDLAGSLIKVSGAGLSAVDNPGASPVLLRDDGNDFARAVFRVPRGTNGAGDLISIRVHDGSIQSSFGPSSPFEVLGSADGASRASSFVLLGTTGGEIVFLDGSFREKRRVSVGGYLQNQAANGHAFEVAAVADLDGSGRREIAVIDSQNRILRLLRGAPGTVSEPSTQVLASNSSPQELCATAIGQVPGLFVAGWTSAGAKLNMIDGTGRTLWSHVFTSDPGGVAEDGTPVGLNVGRFGPTRTPGVLVTVGSTRVLPRTTYALDLATGVVLWKSTDAGGWWDANTAVVDVNGDGSDDVLINSVLSKAFLINGVSGGQAGAPVLLPEFDDLGLVDYNGAPIVVRRGVDGLRVLIAQDDAHLSLVSVGEPCGTSPGCPARLIWASPQTRVDAERRSMAAVAPTSDGSVVVGVGSNSGELRAVRELDGGEAWHVTLAGGGVVPESIARPNALSSVLAIDVDGDGRSDFVAGGADGWLYALDGETGRLIWSFDLGAPVGDPIAADFDNVGYSKLLVPAGDGYLYAIAGVDPGAVPTARTSSMSVAGRN